MALTGRHYGGSAGGSVTGRTVGNWYRFSMVGKRTLANRQSWVLIAVLLIGSACGASSGSTATDTPTTTGAPIAGDDAGCPPVPFSGALSRSVANGHTEVQRADGEMINSIAVARRVDVAYTIYLADFAINADELGATLTAPPGSVLVTFAIDETEGITVGRHFGNTENSFPFVIIDSGGGATDSAAGHGGEETVIGLSDTMICFEIEYQDDVKSINGTVSARIVPTP